MFRKLLISIIFLVSLAGCTSMRPLDMAQADFADRLEAGDRLVIYEKYGRIVDMKLTQVENGILFGSLTNNGLETVEVDLADVEKIEIEKISGAKTTGAVVGGIILLPVVAAGAVLAVAASGT